MQRDAMNHEACPRIICSRIFMKLISLPCIRFLGNKMRVDILDKVINDSLVQDAFVLAFVSLKDLKNTHLDGGYGLYLYGEMAG